MYLYWPTKVHNFFYYVWNMIEQSSIAYYINQKLGWDNRFTVANGRYTLIIIGKAHNGTTIIAT